MYKWCNQALTVIALSCFFPFTAAANDFDKCIALDGTACRNSDVCSWDCGVNQKTPYSCTSQYFCRPKNDLCELGFKQTEFDVWPDDEIRKKCESRVDCFFDKRGCYCNCDDRKNTGCVCACGGGAPPNCRTKEGIEDSVLKECDAGPCVSDKMKRWLDEKNKISNPLAPH